MKVITTLFLALAMASVATVNAQEKKAPDMDAVFKKKDANADGKLSKEEFTKGAKDAAKAETQFGAKDKDKSGDLSAEEFKAGGKKKKK